MLRGADAVPAAPSLGERPPATPAAAAPQDTATAPSRWEMSLPLDVSWAVKALHCFEEGKGGKSYVIFRAELS